VLTGGWNAEFYYFHRKFDYFIYLLIILDNHRYFS